MSDPIAEAAEAIRGGGRVIAVTGAGMSAESGIPTFRDPGGIWEKYPPEEFAAIGDYMQNPMKVWAFWRELAQDLIDCQPNPGHRALAELEAFECLDAIVTQNVDGLHQEAGSTKVIEYHGNARALSCMHCRHSEPLDPSKFPASPPHCYCGGLMKPDVIMFGEMIPGVALMESEALAQNCAVCIVAGTSAQVFPAAQIPVTAKDKGAFIIEVNIEETDFTRSITDAFLHGPVGTELPRLVEAVKAT